MPNGGYTLGSLAHRMSQKGWEEPDDPLLSRHSVEIRGLHTPAFLAAQGGLLYASLDSRRGRPLPPSSQKSGAGIGHSFVPGGLFERERQLGAGPYVSISSRSTVTFDLQMMSVRSV